MNILALETATDNCSVALSIGYDIHVQTELAPRKQAQLLLPMVDAMLAEAGIARAQLDALVFGQGPGSFTGLRVAAAASQGIAMALDLPVVGVSVSGLHRCAYVRGLLGALSHHRVWSI